MAVQLTVSPPSVILGTACRKLNTRRGPFVDTERRKKKVMLIKLLYVNICSLTSVYFPEEDGGGGYLE
jgi:hypothetical protein